MWQRILSIGLALAVLCLPLSALPPPSPPPSSDTSSVMDEMAVALEQARAQLVASNQAIEKLSMQLEKSSELIKTQSQQLTRLWLGIGLLGTIAILEGTALVIDAIKR